MGKDEVLKKMASMQDEFKKFAVKSVYLFGSFARDEAEEGSDLDILVEFESNSPVGLFESHVSSLTPTGVKGRTMSGINDYIDNEVKSQDVVLFMKGTPGFPQCGFSGQVVQILDYVGVDYKGVNVLTSNELRQGIKDYSNWPTIPQLYVKGEFVGGCDIIREMYESGELQDYLKEHGVPVKA